VPPVLAGHRGEIRLGGQAYRVVALDGTSARLADVTGSVTVMMIGHLPTDPGFELVAPHRRVLPAASGLEFLPGEVRASAQRGSSTWWRCSDPVPWHDDSFARAGNRMHWHRRRSGPATQIDPSAFGSGRPERPPA